MKPRAIPTLLLITVFLTLPATAQKAAPEAQMTPAEVKRLATLLDGFWSLNKYEKHYVKKHEAAQNALMKALDQVGKAHPPATPPAADQPGWSHLLKMVDSWAQVFQTAAIPGKSPKVISKKFKGVKLSKGRASQLHVERKNKGKTLGFDYSLLLPQKYDHKQSWPLIVSLPPVDVEAKNYMKAVWLAKDLDKAVRDRFVIMVVTLGKKTRPKKTREAMTITGFNRIRMFNIYWPLIEVRKMINIDPDRIYLEGSRSGGRIAARLATLRMKDFAAVSLRNAAPERVDTLPNLAPVPLRFHVRKGDALARDKDKTLRQQILEVYKKTQKLDVDIVDYEPLPRAALAKFARSAGGDPVPEATAAIMAEFAKARRNPYPHEVTFLTTDRMFSRGPWFQLTISEVDEKAGVLPMLEATIDKKENVINIKADHIYAINFFLNDRLVDMDRLLRIVVNDKTLVEEKTDRSLDSMLGYNRGNPLDPGVVVTKQIRVKVPEKLDEEEAGKDDGKKPGDAGGGEDR